ncbi:MAG: bifunctional riboflavin kinase/FAD synthetase, partial [Gammaproteobacteria bacterium]|nr:bifunctional riboflavin kinase/FAD synthetase [Gammaproteobacteria bacterium]
TDTCLFEGERISSSRIRQALANDDLTLARGLLGRDYAISGRVVHGDKRGKELGFATANMELHRLHSPVMGVFITRVHIKHNREPGESSHHAVTSIGTRPMFDGEGIRLETHILDFDETIYAKHIRVEFLEKLRSEMKYSDVNDLKKAIESDIENARQYFAKNSRGVEKSSLSID